MKYFTTILFAIHLPLISFAASDRLNLSVWTQERLNDDPSFTYTTIKPALVYRLDSEKVKINAIMAILFNRIETRVKWAQTDFSFDSGLETLFILAGDNPRIDGVDYSDDAFNAHRIGAYGGAAWESEIADISTVLKLRYRLHHLNPYDFSNTPTINKPVSHLAHGPEFIMDLGDGRPPMEILDHDRRLHFHSLYSWRKDSNAWGRPSFLREISRYFVGSVGASFRKSLNPKFEMMFMAQGSLVTRADRLNAFSDGAYSQENLGLCLGEYKADRATTGAMMLKITTMAEQALMIAPLIHTAVLREVTPTRYRNVKGWGGGLKLSGVITRKFVWDLTYANLFGARNDLNGLHEAKLMLNYNFY